MLLAEHQRVRSAVLSRRGELHVHLVQVRLQAIIGIGPRALLLLAVVGESLRAVELERPLLGVVVSRDRLVPPLVLLLLRWEDAKLNLLVLRRFRVVLKQLANVPQADWLVGRQELLGVLVF